MFQNTKGMALKIMVFEMGLGGIGLDLTAAQTVVLLDVTTDDAVMSQAIGRVSRIGQRCPVQVVTVVCKGTVDEVTFGIQESNRTNMTPLRYSTRQYPVPKHELTCDRTACKAVHHSGSFSKRCHVIKCAVCEFPIPDLDSVLYVPHCESLGHMSDCREWHYDEQLGPLPIDERAFNKNFWSCPFIDAPLQPRSKFDESIYCFGNCLLVNVNAMLVGVPLSVGKGIGHYDMRRRLGVAFDSGFDELIAAASKEDAEVLTVLKQVHQKWRNEDTALISEPDAVSKHIAPLIASRVLPRGEVYLTRPTASSSR